jgi:putative ABC transport system permease protein
MRSLREMMRFLRSRIDRRALDREMDEEMALHIELHAETLERAGLSPSEARRRAVAEFGGVQRYREESREARAFAWLHDVVADLRYGVRTLRHAPLFTSVSVLSLSLGIGANVAIFGLLYGLLMQPLPIPRPHELAALVIVQDEPYTSILHRNYLALRDAPGAPRLESVHEADDVFVDAGVVSAYSRTEFVDGGFFSLVGVSPLMGRVISREDDAQHAPVIVISEQAWSYFFARDPNVLGRPMSLRAQPFTVIGVMPKSYRGVRFNGSFSLAVPASFAPNLGIREDHNYVNVLARIENAPLRGAFAARLEAVFHRCCVDEEMGKVTHIRLVEAGRGIPYGKNDFRDDYRLMLWLLMGAVGLVLLVACSNVGTLLLARGAVRQREIATRLSIGASRSRVVRQLLAESALLAAAGAIVGLLVAALANRLLVVSLPSGFESAAALVEFGMKGPVIAFTTLVAVVSTLFFGVGPALRATRHDPARSLGERSGTRRRDARITDRLLVVGQVAVTLVLVCGASLLVVTLRNLRAIDPGFVSTNLVALEVETRGTAFERRGIAPVHREILDRARAVRGITTAAMATRVPAIGGRNASFPYSLPGRPTEPTQLSVTVISPGYFATIRTPILVGRDFTDDDSHASPRVAIVNEAFVRRHFPSGLPLGTSVRLDALNGGEAVAVVGVVHDVRLGDRRSAPEPMMFIPVSQAGNWPFLLLVMRTGPATQRVLPELMHALEPYSRRLRVGMPQTMEEAFDEVLLRERLAAALATASGALALLLAMVGLGGVVGFSVTRRTSEIGVRMALGARRSTVVWLVLRGALAMTAAGVLIGGPLALGAGRALQSLLYGVAPTNVLLVAGSAMGLVGVALLASAAPAWRAARVDPVIALRAD